MKAIPTTRNGTNYRSRLEARWAAFFDLVGWEYEYEPVDLNGWIPDFALFGSNPLAGTHGIKKKREIVYVEVKPLMWTGSTEEEYLLTQVREKSDQSKEQCKRVLIVGAALETGMEYRSFGLFANYQDKALYWGQAHFGWWRNQQHPGFSTTHSVTCSRLDIISGQLDEQSWGDRYWELKDVHERMRTLWNMAGGKSQWKGR